MTYSVDELVFFFLKKEINLIVEPAIFELFFWSYMIPFSLTMHCHFPHSLHYLFVVVVGIWYYTALRFCFVFKDSTDRFEPRTRRRRQLCRHDRVYRSIDLASV